MNSYKLRKRTAFDPIYLCVNESQRLKAELAELSEEREEVDHAAAQEYLERTTAIAAAEGRVAATPAEGAKSEYVDDMVSTDTQELDF